jgi:hypothetical protein
MGKLLCDPFLVTKRERTSSVKADVRLFYVRTRSHPGNRITKISLHGANTSLARWPDLITILPLRWLYKYITSRTMIGKMNSKCSIEETLTAAMICSRSMFSISKRTLLRSDSETGSILVRRKEIRCNLELQENYAKQ